MPRLGKVALSAAVILIGFVGLSCGLSYWYFSRHFGDAFAQFLGLTTVAIERVAVIQRDSPSTNLSDLDSRPESMNANVKMVEAFARALETASRAQIEASSPSDTVLKTDPWGHPYCVASSASTIVVISQGPTNETLLCNKTTLQADLLAGVPRGRLIKTDRGHLVLLLDRVPLAKKSR